MCGEQTIDLRNHPNVIGDLVGPLAKVPFSPHWSVMIPFDASRTATGYGDIHFYAAEREFGGGSFHSINFQTLDANGNMQSQGNIGGSASTFEWSYTQVLHLAYYPAVRYIKVATYGDWQGWGVTIDELTVTGPICGQGIATVTPTPAPTGGYCSSVEPAQISPEMELPIPKVGPATCQQLGGFTIGLGWVSSLGQLVGVVLPESVQMPGINLCVRPIEFGLLNLFGLWINLDLIAGVMAGVMVIRILVRS